MSLKTDTHLLVIRECNKLNMNSNTVETVNNVDLINSKREVKFFGRVKIQID